MEIQKVYLTETTAKDILTEEEYVLKGILSVDYESGRAFFSSENIDLILEAASMERYTNGSENWIIIHDNYSNSYVFDHEMIGENKNG